MTESAWLTDPDFKKHVHDVQALLSNRKHRLLAVAFCRCAEQFREHPDLSRVLEIAERFAEGACSAAELEMARQRCRVVAVQADEEYKRRIDDEVAASRLQIRKELAWAASYAAMTPCPLIKIGEEVCEIAAQARRGMRIPLVPEPSSERLLTIAERAIELRAAIWDLVGNPFAPAEFDPDWRTSTAVAIASQIEAYGDDSAMPILADALQDAGCEDAAILDHCRAPIGHFHGCWVLDAILEKD